MDNLSDTAGTPITAAQLANLPEGARTIVGAVGEYKSVGTANGPCLAVHLGNGVVLTEAVCVVGTSTPIPRTRTDVSTSAGFDNANAGCLAVGDISWKTSQLLHGASAPLVSRCVQIFAVQNDEAGNEYALVRVDSAPPESVKARLDGHPAVGSLLRAVYFENEDFISPPPPPRWSKRCSVQATLSPSLFTHDCATGTLSGFVFDDATLELVGVDTFSRHETSTNTTIASDAIPFGDVQDYIDHARSKLQLVGGPADGSTVHGSIDFDFSTPEAGASIVRLAMLDPFHKVTEGGPSPIPMPHKFTYDTSSLGTSTRTFDFMGATASGEFVQFSRTLKIDNAASGTSSDGPPSGPGPQCGSVQCHAGETCCNPLDGICAGPHEFCAD